MGLVKEAGIRKIERSHKHKAEEGSSQKNQVEFIVICRNTLGNWYNENIASPTHRLGEHTKHKLTIKYQDSKNKRTLHKQGFCTKHH